MTHPTKHSEQIIEQETAAWGVRPVPMAHRRLSGFDLGILWTDLAVGLLVLLTGTLLVPKLGLPKALVAIVVGSVIGCVPLALVALAGQREGVPTMVLFRPVLGRRGSCLPSILNIVQLIGWTGFEFWAMSLVANQMSIRLYGFSSYWLWLGVIAIVCTALALGGPVLVIRKWLKRFGAWVIGAVGILITVRVLTAGDVGSLWSRPGTGGLPFWLAVDLVIAQPVSWLPLAADYSRFARSPRAAAGGTFLGYVAGNIWFYALGALLALSAGMADATPVGLAQAIASLAGGWIMLVTLLVGETDQAFADIYSAAVSSLNLRDRIPRRGAIIAAAAAGVVLAAWLGGRPGSGIAAFESFLFLLGSVFVPLFGVFVADYFILRRQPHSGEARSGRGRAFGAHAPGLVAWALGFAVYQWSAPTGPAGWLDSMGTLFRDWLHLPFPLAGSAAGASVPAFAAALLIHLAVARVMGPRTRVDRAQPLNG